MGVPQDGWFVTKTNHTKMDDLRAPRLPCRKPPYGKHRIILMVLPQI